MRRLLALIEGGLDEESLPEGETLLARLASASVIRFAMFDSTLRIS